MPFDPQPYIDLIGHAEAMRRTIHIDLFYSAEDGEFVARLSHAHGISALGATPSDALRELSVVAGMIPEEFTKGAGAPTG